MWDIIDKIIKIRPTPLKATISGVLMSISMTTIVFLLKLLKINSPLQDIILIFFAFFFFLIPGLIFVIGIRLIEFTRVFQPVFLDVDRLKEMSKIAFRGLCWFLGATATMMVISALKKQFFP